MRAGFTYAEGTHRLGRDCGRERNRALTWGLVIPVILILGSVLSGPITLIAFLVYPLQILRLALREKHGYRVNLTYAGFEILGRFPEMIGVVKYYFNLVTGKTSGLIEYKKPLAAAQRPKKNEN